MTAAAPEPYPGRLMDEPVDLAVVAAEVVFHGSVWDVRREAVDLGAAGEVVRDFIDHPGAVGVLALDADDRVLLVRQYRHPVRAMLWELPAGLCDVAGEPFEVTAARELWEETGYETDHLEPLFDALLTPGSSSERFVLFLAPEVRLASRERHAGHGEEHGMEVAWWPFAEVLEAVLAGRLRNPSVVLGTLVLAERRRRS